MSTELDPTLFKAFLSKMMHVVDLVENVDHLETVAKALESRVASLQKQEADILGQYNAVRDKAKAEAKAMADAAKAETDQFQATIERALQAKTDHAKAELETIAQQRHRDETEIVTLREQTAALREQKELARQELAFVKDGLATAKAAHESVKKQLAELKQAL